MLAVTIKTTNDKIARELAEWANSRKDAEGTVMTFHNDQPYVEVTGPHVPLFAGQPDWYAVTAINDDRLQYAVFLFPTGAPESKARAKCNAERVAELINTFGGVE